MDEWIAPMDQMSLGALVICRLNISVEMGAVLIAKECVIKELIVVIEVMNHQAADVILLSCINVGMEVALINEEFVMGELIAMTEVMNLQVAAVT